MNEMNPQLAGFIKQTEEKDPIAAAFADFLYRHGKGGDEGKVTAALTGAIVSRQLTCGNICIKLSDGANYYIQNLGLSAADNELPLSMKDSQTWAQSLISAGAAAAAEEAAWSGNPAGKVAPLVYELKSDKLYLQRYWVYEKLIAKELVAHTADNTAGKSKDAKDLFASELNALFAEDIEAMQKQAVQNALLYPFSVVTGGPGTGKTYTAAIIIFLKLLANPELKLAATAPTGKAAARLGEALDKAVGRITSKLSASGVSNPNATIALEKIKAVKGTTIHRLLGTKPDNQSFEHNKENPLPYKLIIADEASMIDAVLMAKLLAAISPDASFILIGDSDQLSSVEAGSVFRDICESGAEEPRQKFNICRLKHNFRSQTGIADLAEAVNKSEGADRLKASLTITNAKNIKSLLSSNMKEFVGIVNPKDSSLEELLQALSDNWKIFIQEKDNKAALGMMNKFKVLAPFREGRLGVNAINTAAEKILRQAGLLPEEQSARGVYENMPVMITQNSYQLGLFNGDTGIVRKDGEHLAAFFERADEPSLGGVKSVPVSMLPAYEKVFAMTVHKSQGSEFETVLLIVPENRGEEGAVAVTRELLYTGITRAQKKLIIYGTAADLAAAAPANRFSGLAERLAGDM